MSPFERDIGNSSRTIVDEDGMRVTETHRSGANGTSSGCNLLSQYEMVHSVTMGRKYNVTFFDIMDARSIGYGTSMEQKFLLESIRMRCQWKWNGTHWKAPLRTSIPPFERQFENQTSFTKRSS